MTSARADRNLLCDLVVHLTLRADDAIAELCPCWGSCHGRAGA